MVAVKSLERVADHAKNVAEEVVYLCDAQDIRHMGVKSQQPTVPWSTANRAEYTKSFAANYIGVFALEVWDGIPSFAVDYAEASMPSLPKSVFIRSPRRSLAKPGVIRG